jgi:hypothetical protein
MFIYKFYTNQIPDNDIKSCVAFLKRLIVGGERTKLIFKFVECFNSSAMTSQYFKLHTSP